MTSGQLPAPFQVDPDLVRTLKELVGLVVARSRHTTLTVPAADFPAWLVALGKEDFHAQTTRNGGMFIRSGYTLVGEDPINSPMVSVTCDTPPAPWVHFPRTEGDRRYMFRYTTNPLADNEKESDQ